MLPGSKDQNLWHSNSHKICTDFITLYLNWQPGHVKFCQIQVTKKIIFLWGFLCYTYTTYRFQSNFTGGKNGKSRTI